MSLESLLFEFHEQRWDSCLSTESVVQSLGTPGCPRFPIPLVDRALLMELASYGMVVVEPPCSSPLVFRRSYLAVSTTVDKLFYKQWLIGSMLIIPTSMAVGIPMGRSWIQAQCEERWGCDRPAQSLFDHDNDLRGS